MLDAIRRWLGREKQVLDEEAAGGLAVATPSAEDQRETSTNAQMAGAADDPYPGNEE
jgi:hypothetical protein